MGADFQLAKTADFEMAIDTLPKVCRTGTEGVLSRRTRTYTSRMVPRARFELATP